MKITIHKGDEFLYFTHETIKSIHLSIAGEIAKNTPDGPCCLGCLGMENIPLKDGGSTHLFVCYNGRKDGIIWDVGIHKALITDTLFCDEVMDIYNELKAQL